MISENPSEAELVQHGIDAAMARMFKAGPGRVTAYDPVTNTAFVQPEVKHATYSVTDGKRSYKALPEIPFVPVLFPRAGGFVARMPVSPGDTVLLVYCDASLAEWREGGGTVEPQDARLHSLGWPVALPGFFPDTSPMSPVDALAAALQMIVGQDGGSQIRIGPTGIELAPAGVTPIMPLALAPPIVIAFAAIAAYVAALTTAAATLPDFTAFAAAMAAPGATLATALAGLGLTVPSTLTRSV